MERLSDLLIAVQTRQQVLLEFYGVLVSALKPDPLELFHGELEHLFDLLVLILLRLIPIQVRHVIVECRQKVAHNAFGFSFVETMQSHGNYKFVGVFDTLG